jgi:hypothetical protein
MPSVGRRRRAESLSIASRSEWLEKGPRRADQRHEFEDRNCMGFIFRKEEK